MQLTGIHHLTAISAAIRDNHRFYTQTLGMRLVKRSVNQDDVSAYHLFYADAVGSPGTDLTFFDWPVAARAAGHAQHRADVPAGARCRDARVVGGSASTSTGASTARSSNATAARARLRGSRRAAAGAGRRRRRRRPAAPWERSPVPAEHQMRGLGPISSAFPTLNPTDALLTRVFNMRPVRECPHPDNPRHAVHVFEMGAGGPHAELHVAVQPDLPTARHGAGGVHHVAFRTPDADYDAWADRLSELDVPNSGKVDRYWFRSLYFREPNGVLFEIATDGPGFAVDEDPATLGEHVVLPPFLEPHRAELSPT